MKQLLCASHLKFLALCSGLTAASTLATPLHAVPEKEKATDSATESATYTVNEDNFKPEFMKAFYEGALKIAEKKIAQVEQADKDSPPPIPLKPRLATGGGFSGLFVWDTVFCTLWAKHEPERFPIATSLDNFYMLQEDDGFICREFQRDGKPYWSREHPISFNPPILCWAEWELFETGVTDKARLQKVYSHLKKHHDFCWKAYRRDDGLFYGDALGGGMDDLPRLPKKAGYSMEGGIAIKEEHITADSKGMWNVVKNNPLYCWNRQMGWVDISAQMAFNALNLSRIAETVGKKDDAAQYRAQHAEMAKLINEKCWDDKLGFYCDSYQGETVPRLHAGAFWVLLAEIVPQERIKRIAATLKDPATFNRPIPLPTLAANEPEYNPENGYWLGSVWPPTTYVAIRGLMKLGEQDLALDFARRYYNANAQLWRKTGTIFENISPEQCDHPKNRAGSDFCGWGALAPVALYKELLIRKADKK